MAIKAFNSIGGFSVGENAANIILANGDITTTNANLTGNLYVSDTANVGNLRTNNLLYANGTAWDLGGNPAGSNTQVQFNNDGEFGASSNFTFNSSTNLLTITGNVNATNANLGNLVTANFFHGLFDSTSSNQANITTVGNLTLLNVDGIANLANVVNVSGNINASANITANANITGANLNTLGLANIGNLEISGTTTGNLIPSANVTFNLGNATNRWKDLFLSGSSILIGDQNISSNASGIALSANTFLVDVFVSGNANVGLALIGNTANFSGNVIAPNVTVNLELSGNTANFSGNVIAANLRSNALTSTRVTFAGTSGILTDSSNLIYNDSTQLLTVLGNSQFNNANLGNLATANFINVASNLFVTDTANVGNLRTNNLLYANGVAWDFITPAGANTEIQFNDGAGNLGASANFTFNTSTNLLTVTGAANISGNVSANYYFGNGSQLQGVVATASDKLANGNTTLTTALNGNISFNIADPANSNVPIANLVVVSSNLLTVNANITTTGTISTNTLTVIGNATVGNLTTSGSGGNITNVNVISANTFIASASVNALALISPTLTSNTTTLTLNAAAGNNDIILVPTGTGAVSISSKKIINLATPTLDSDAATKAYVDSVAQGLDPKASVVYATVTGLPAYTYNNGTSGIGATITGNAVGALSIDGSAVSVNERVLIKNETTTNAPYNGIYVVTATGSGAAAYVLTRTSDFDSASPSGEIPGAFVFVEYGTTNADTGWVCTTNAPVTVGTTDIVFVQFSGAGSFTANTSAGLVLIGSQFNAKVDGNANPTTAFDGNGNIYVPAGAAFTTPNIGAATGTSLVATAGVTANTLTANLTLSVTGNANVGNLGTGGLIIATGNISGGNIITAGEVVATGNGTFANISTTGSGGNITGANVMSANTVIANTLTANVTLNVTGIANIGNLNVTGLSNLGNVGNVTITGGTSGQVLSTNGSGGLSFVTINSSGISNGTSNVNIPTVNGNVNITSAGNTTMVITGTGANISGNLDVTGNLTAGNITGANNISANTFTSIITTGTAPFVVTSTTQVANLNVATAGTAGLATAVTGNAQGNITSVGTLTSLDVTGTITGGNLSTTGSANAGTLAVTGTSNLGAVGNVTITGGTSGQVLSTNGSGGLSFVTINSSGISNGTSNVNIPTVNGNVNITAAGNTTMVITGTGANIAGNLDVTGNLTAGNITTAGSAGNITGANVISANTLAIGNTSIKANTVSTSAITANQTIATYLLTGSSVTGVEFLVKGYDASGSKYSVATVLAVTDGTDTDYTIFGTVRIGTTTGALAVNVASGNILLQVTPSSSNSTAWTTQIRTI